MIRANTAISCCCCCCLFSRVRLCVTPLTAAHQAPPSLGFSRQEHWSGLPFPSPMHESARVKVKSLSHVWLLATPWTAAYQAPPSMGYSRQEYWSGVPLPSRHRKIVKKANYKRSYHRKNFSLFFFILFLLYLYQIEVNWIYCGNHFALYVNQTIMLDALNLHSDVCQIFLNKLGKRFFKK